MRPSFLQDYLKAFDRIEGWFSYDAALLFFAYNQLIRDAGIAGDALEIGVYHGLSAIAVAQLRGPGRRFFAVDLFEELQDNQAYGQGAAYRKRFESNFQSFYGDLDSVVTVAACSGDLKPEDFTHSFSFCHVDGGHSAEETYADLHFASHILLPGGLVALDDYFNPQHPGVSEGAVDFRRKQPGVLRPLAIGFNKVLFQKLPSTLDLNAEILRRWPNLPHRVSTLWGEPALLFEQDLRRHFDLYSSTPDRLQAFEHSPHRAEFWIERQPIVCRRNKACTFTVTLANLSSEEFPHGDKVFGLSYHLLSAAMRKIQHDNPRTYLTAPLPAGGQVRLPLIIPPLSTPGRYYLELDLVWEGVTWFKQIGNPTCLVEVEVR